MARFLHVVPHWSGHLRPHLAIAEELRRRGHEVAVASSPRSRAKVEIAGCRAFSLSGLRAGEERTERLNDGRSSLFEAARWWLTGYLSADSCLAEIREVSRIVESWRPEMIVFDQWAFGSVFVVPEVYDLRCAIVGITPFNTLAHRPGRPGKERLSLQSGVGFQIASERRAWLAALRWVEQRHLAHANRWRRGHGLGPIEGGVEEFHRRQDLLLLCGVPELELDRREPTPNLRYVGPCLWEEPVSEEVKRRVETLTLDRQKPLICASLGSLHLHGSFREVFFDAVVKALASLPLHAVITTGSAGYRGRALPLNIALAEWLPHRLLLPHAAALITNGGAGTLAEALRAQVPMLVVPFHSDQAENAAMIAQANLGVALSASQCTARRIRLVLARLLTDSSMSESLRSMGSLLERYDGPREAARLLESVVEGGPEEAEAPVVEERAFSDAPSR